jgi:hypothetical protein
MARAGLESVLHRISGGWFNCDVPYQGRPEKFVALFGMQPPYQAVAYLTEVVLEAVDVTAEQARSAWRHGPK